MAYVIGQVHKIGRQNRKQRENTTNTSSAPSTPSYSYAKLNENTHITSRISLTADINSCTIFYLDDKTAVIIQKEPASKPYTNAILISNISVGADA